MAETLTVWLYGLRIARIRRDGRRRLRLSYTPEALDAYAPGTPLLSLSLPLVAQEYSHAVVAAFLDGMLPEGDPRLAIAANRRVSPEDTFALMRELGRDSAGGLIILPSDEILASDGEAPAGSRISDSELAEMVANLRNAPLGIASGVRISLAGVQEKLVLTRLPDGGWTRPHEGTPSTHILKPAIGGYAGTVQNEAFCMRLAAHLRLPVAQVETATLNDHEVLIVSRYDRVIDSAGRVSRIHQEDICQALGLPPTRKYEETGGPSLKRTAQLLETYATPSALEQLLRAVVVNALLGNCDAHGKNFSIVHDPAGPVRFAPLYDLLSTRIYNEKRLAMFINRVQLVDRVASQSIVNEAAGWGIDSQRATDIVVDLLDRTADAADLAAKETPGVPQPLLDLLESQTKRLRI